MISPNGCRQLLSLTSNEEQLILGMSGKIRRHHLNYNRKRCVMRDIYKDYLFEKHILVSEETTEEKHVFEVLFAMTFLWGKNYKRKRTCAL